MIRAVLDSSVLISAFLTEGGPPHAVLSAAKEGRFVLCLSHEILAETGRSLREKITIRRSYTYSDERIETHIDDLIAVAELAVELPKLRVVPDDPKDDMIVATAVKAKADYLVSGDRHLLSLGEHDGIRIITPRELLALIGPPTASQTPDREA